MDSRNPLISAPHVPPQTAAPKWGHFLDGSFQMEMPPELTKKHQQLQTVSWYQVNNTQQSVWPAQLAAHQGHQPGDGSCAAAAPKQSWVASRWRQQLKPAVQPSQQIQPSSAGSSRDQYGSAPAGGGWVERKRAQQKAAAKSFKGGGGGCTAAGTEQKDQQGHSQLHISLQHQQPAQLNHTEAVPIPGAGLHIQPGRHRDHHNHNHQQQQHCKLHEWFVDDDVHLPENDEWPQQQENVMQQWPQHATGLPRQQLGQQRHQQQPGQLQQQEQCVQGKVQLQGVPCQTEPWSQQTEQQPHHDAVAPQQQQHHRQQQPQHEELKQPPKWNSIDRQQQQRPLSLATMRTVDAATANKWAAGPAMTTTHTIKVAKPLGTLHSATTAAADVRAGRGNGARALASAATSDGSTRSRPAGIIDRGGRCAGGRGGHGCKDSNSTTTASNMTTEFVAKPKGSYTSSEKQKQDRMRQETIQETLGRANKNKKQQQAESQQQQHQGDIAGAGHASKAAIPSKRKHTGSAAAAAEGQAADIVGTTGTGSGAGSAAAGGASGGAGQGSSRGRKRSRTSAQAAGTAAAELQGAAEVLDLCLLNVNSSTGDRDRPAPHGAGSAAVKHCSTTCIWDLNNPATWQQLQTEIPTAASAAMGLLICQRAGQAVQYCSSLQQLSKEQLMLLRKHTKVTSKASAASNIGARGEGSAVGPCEVVGLAIMPVTVNTVPGQTATIGERSCCNMYYCHLAAGDALPEPRQQQGLPAEALQLLPRLLSSPSCCPCVCSNAKSVLCSLAGLGVDIPAAGTVSLVDPEVLGWLADPQLVQDCKQAGCYTLQVQLERLGLQQASSVVSSTSQSPGPLQRLYQQLQQSVQLADHLLNRLKDSIAGEAIKLEMQVSAVLARMELAGVGISPQYLLDHKATLLQRIAAINSQAAAYAGRPLNLSSASQLAVVLYDDLKLPPPASKGGRGSAKTHLPTDEQTLKHLASMHPLPGLVIEYRCMQNVLTKWVDSDWVQEATRQAAAADSGSADVRCSWNQLATATGRLSSSSPNLQAVTKYTITAHRQVQPVRSAPTSGPCVLFISVRDAFVARPGMLLLSADYSQIELRLLAHFSGDPLLCQLLHQSGSQGDVFKLIAAAWMQPGARPGSGDVDVTTRERAKRVVYGIIYGLSAFGLSQQLADQGVTVDGAEALIRSFLNRFQDVTDVVAGVQHFMSSCLQNAQSTGSVKTLLQRTRLIAGLAASNHKDKSAAERKVVNSIVQGSAADLIKLAMREWDDWATSTGGRQHSQGPLHAVQGQPSSSCRPGGARLIAQIHDELLFEVDVGDAMTAAAAADGSTLAPDTTLHHVAQVVQGIMAMEKLHLSVPLKVNLSWGQRWGSLQSMECSP